MSDESVVRVAGATATGPTALSAYDAALAEIGLANYNLVTLSSVLPAEASVERVDAAPDLGPAGSELRVVQARATAPPLGADASDHLQAGVTSEADLPDSVAAGLGWATGPAGQGPAPGIFYEAAGADADVVERELREGLDAGASLREWDLPDRDVEIVTAGADPTAYTAAVVVAAYGRATPIF